MYQRSLVAVLLFTTSALADFSYQTTSRVTGGAMAGMMKMAGAFSAKAREPIVSTVLIKGDRMAHVSRDHISVIDISKETITDINLDKKTYSVITFAEMTEMMKRAAEKMNQKNDAEMNFKAAVKETGQTKTISGFNTREFLVTLTIEGRDTKSGQAGAMDMQMDMWVAPTVAGYEEVRDFYRKMSTKTSWNPMASAAGAMAQQNAKGFAELAKEMSKLDGIPVLQITRMGGSGMPAGTEISEADRQKIAEAQQQRAQAEQQQAQSADEARKNAAAEAIAGRLGRLGGGLGGFGRKKKTEQPPAAQPQQQASAPAVGSSNSAPGVLMELTTESSNFSSASVDSSKFEVPAGFKQVDHDMKKMR